MAQLKVPVCFVFLSNIENLLMKLRLWILISLLLVVSNGSFVDSGTEKLEEWLEKGKDEISKFDLLAESFGISDGE